MRKNVTLKTSKWHFKLFERQNKITLKRGWSGFQDVQRFLTRCEYYGDVLKSLTLLAMKWGFASLGSLAVGFLIGSLIYLMFCAGKTTWIISSSVFGAMALHYALFPLVDKDFRITNAVIKSKFFGNAAIGLEDWLREDRRLYRVTAFTAVILGGLIESVWGRVFVPIGKRGVKPVGKGIGKGITNGVLWIVDGVVGIWEFLNEKLCPFVHIEDDAGLYPKPIRSDENDATSTHHSEKAATTVSGTSYSNHYNHYYENPTYYPRNFYSRCAAFIGEACNDEPFNLAFRRFDLSDEEKQRRKVLFRFFH